MTIDRALARKDGPLVVETVVADTMKELIARRDRDTPADMLELRLDGVRDVDVPGALSGRRHPVIVTCRPTWEGGRFDGREEERQGLLGQAARLGAEFVDVEWRADRSLFEKCLRGPALGVVISHHDFSGVPADLDDRVDAMRRMGARIVKVAVKAESIADCMRLKDAVHGTDDHVAIAMGSAGQITRLWPAWIGSRWTYGGNAAPGQVAVKDLIECYRVRDTTAGTAVYGVTGSPLGHSASPAMHNAAFVTLGIDAVYLPFETNKTSEFLAAADVTKLGGASVTIPLKQALLTPDVCVDDLPRQIGALNTLRRGPNGWEGRNFDVAGFLAPLDERSVELSDRRVVVLGAGGAARASAWALRSRGARVEISARRASAAQALAAELGVRAAGPRPDPGWDMLVNTTPVGMRPGVEESPLDERDLRGAAGHVVYDLVYNPLDTRLLRLAAAAGAQVIGGLEMLVAQACRQFEWWTGRAAPAAVMEQAARAFLAAQN